MRPLKQCASSSQRVRFPHSEGKQTVVWMTRSEIPVAVRSLLPASPSEGSQRERAVEARSPPGSSPSLYWNPRGPKPANRGSRGKRLGSHRWCAAEPENWEGGWRSGLGNLSSFSINHQLAFAARPVTCSEKAAPSGFWKLGAKTNLARGLPEGLPHPLLTCCLCSFFFFFFARRCKLKSRPLAPQSSASDCAAPGSVAGSSAPLPAVFRELNGLGLAPPHPEGTPLGLRTGPKSRPQPRSQALPERGWPPSPARLRSPRPSPCLGPCGEWSCAPCPAPLTAPPKNTLGRLRPHGHSGDGALPRPTPPHLQPPGLAWIKSSLWPRPRAPARAGWEAPPAPHHSPVSVLPNGPATSSAFLNIPRLLPGRWKVLPASPPLPPSAPGLYRPRHQPS